MLFRSDCTVLSFDARDPETVLTARITVAEAVDRIVCEEPFPEPGYWCRWCPVAQWCGARQEAATGEGAEADQLSDDIPAGSRGRVRLLALSETPVSDDDDIPF